MAQYITKEQLADALTQTSTALTISMPYILKAVSEKNPKIAVDKLSAIANQADAKGDEFAALFMDKMTQAIKFGWNEFLDEHRTNRGHRQH